MWAECWTEIKSALPEGIGLACRYGIIVVIVAWAIHYVLGAFGDYSFDVKFR